LIDVVIRQVSEHDKKNSLCDCVAIRTTVTLDLNGFSVLPLVRMMVIINQKIIFSVKVILLSSR